VVYPVYALPNLRVWYIPVYASPYHPFHCWARSEAQAPLSGNKPLRMVHIPDKTGRIKTELTTFDNNVRFRRARVGPPTTRFTVGQG